MKYVYRFHEGNAGMRNLLGGKGANLAEMTVMGLPVPGGFTISTEACTEYNIKICQTLEWVFIFPEIQVKNLKTE